MSKIFLIFAFLFFDMEASCSDKANAMNIFSTENQVVMKHKMQAVAENDSEKVQISKNSVVEEENVKSKKAFIPKVAHAIKNTCLSVIKVGLLGVSCIHLVLFFGCLKLIFGIFNPKKLFKKIFDFGYNKMGGCRC